MTNLKSITELPVAESAEGLNLIVNDHGSAKQIPASEVGAQADFAVTDENSPAFIKNKPQVAQSDWAETDDTSASFIKNKPVRELVKEWNFSPDDLVYYIEEDLDEDFSWMTVKSDTVGFEIVFEFYGIDKDEEVAPAVVDGSMYILLPDTILSAGFSDVYSSFVLNPPWDIHSMVCGSTYAYFFETDNGVDNCANAYYYIMPDFAEIYNNSDNPFKSVKIYKVIK